MSLLNALIEESRRRGLGIRVWNSHEEASVWPDGTVTWGCTDGATVDVEALLAGEHRRELFEAPTQIGD